MKRTLTRSEQIVEAFRAPDATMASVGERFGITGERVRQIVARHEERTGEWLGRFKTDMSPNEPCEDCGRPRNGSSMRKCARCAAHMHRHGTPWSAAVEAERAQRSAERRAAVMHAYETEVDLDTAARRLGYKNAQTLRAMAKQYGIRRPAHIDGRRRRSA